MDFYDLKMMICYSIYSYITMQCTNHRFYGIYSVYIYIRYILISYKPEYTYYIIMVCKNRFWYTVYIILYIGIYSMMHQCLWYNVLYIYIYYTCHENYIQSTSPANFLNKYICTVHNILYIYIYDGILIDRLIDLSTCYRISLYIYLYSARNI